ncbi:MAG: hypothetical protein U5J83_16590 [Bryobacterales bacterium]|nr:hypothetical protein [Bryobacterales bacterium]
MPTTRCVTGHCRAASRPACSLLALRITLGCALALLSWTLSAQPSRIDPGLRQLLTKSLSLTAADLDRAERGDPVAVAFDSESQKAIGIVGLVWVEGSHTQFLDDQRTMSEHAGTKAMPEAGIFGAPPSLADLRGLHLDPSDLESLSACRTGACGVKLFREDERGVAGIDESGQRDGKRIVAAYHGALLRAVSAYKSRGNRALGDYVDKAETVNAAAEFDALLAETPFLKSAVPQLEKYLRQYPAAKPHQSEDIFYWSKIAFGLKPTVRVNHMTLYANPGNPQMPWVVASKQIYAAHYLQAALELRFVIVPEAGKAKRGFYLLTVSQSRNDGMEGFWRGIVRAIVRSRARDGVQRYLAFAQHRFGGKALLEAHNAQPGPKPTEGQ